MDFSELLLKRSEIAIPHPDKGYFVCPIHPEILNLAREVRTDYSIAASAIPDAEQMALASLRSEEWPEAQRTWLRENFTDRIDKGERTLFPHTEHRVPALIYLDFVANEIVTAHQSRSGVYYATADGHERGRIDSRLFRVSFEKAREYCPDGIREISEDYFAGDCHAWLTHNVDTLFQAIVYSSWCITYHNLLLARALC